jgi:hypothetical protein
MALVNVRREAGLVTWQSKTLKWELENNSRQPRGLTGTGRVTAWNKSLLTLSHGKMNKGDAEVDHIDEWEPIRLPQVHATGIQGTEELWHRTRFTVNRPTLAAMWGVRGRLSPYTSHVIGGRNNDGQHGHIIGPSLVSHSPARHSCRTGFTTVFSIKYNNNILFCDCRRQIKPKINSQQDSKVGLYET